MIGLLNGYFDAMCGPIEKHGGEILKFMGDGLLAIFPLSNPEACGNLLRAITEAQAAMRALNAENVAMGHQELGYGIGVHVGDVMYGNIGSRSRLDFTVIGPAVNVASRIESLTKVVKRQVLLSRAFADMAGCTETCESLGQHPFKGLPGPHRGAGLPVGWSGRRTLSRCAASLRERPAAGSWPSDPPWVAICSASLYSPAHSTHGLWCLAGRNPAETSGGGRGFAPSACVRGG